MIMKSFKRIITNVGHVNNRAVLVVVFIIFGTAIIFYTSAATFSSDVQPENGNISSSAIVTVDTSASSGKAVKFGSVRRFFSSDATWNKTISQIGGEYSELKPYANRLWDYGGGTANGSPPGNFYLNFKDYSVPIYSINTATTTAKVFQLVWSQNQQSLSQSGRIKIGDSVPWNPNWKPGTGNDKILQVVNYNTGKVFGFWVVGESPLGCVDFFGPNGQAGYDPNNPNHVCVAGVDTYDNLWTAKDGTTTSERGMGINKLALVVRAEEVASGNIGHALSLTTSNPMFGAGIDTPGVVSPTETTNGSDPLGIGMVNPKNDPFQLGAGIAKGFYLKPATRLEHEYGFTGRTLGFGSVTLTPFTDSERSKTNPSGMRFGLNITETDIDSWLNSKNYQGVKRETARTFARAWRDYGAIIAETGGYGIGIELDGIIGGSLNPAVAKWAALGITDDGTQAQSINTIDFKGLITRDRLYVVKYPQ
jgi:hypothetical protein